MSNPISRFLQRAAFLAGAYKYQQKKNLLLFPKYIAQNALWLLSENENYISEGFALNAIIYSAIMYKSRAAQSAQLRAYTGSRAQPEPLPDSHPLSMLLDRPNPWQSFIELDMEARVYFSIFGNAYVYFRRGRDGYPVEFFNLPPYRVRHIYDRGALKGYVYIQPGGTVRNGQPIDKRDLMHVKLPNPGDPFNGQGKGLSPLAPGGQSADVDNALTAYLKQFVDYGAMPPGILTMADAIGENEAAAARERFMEIYGGAHRWTDIAVLGGGAEYQAIGSKLNELASNILDARNENRMAMVLGVPLPLIDTNPQIVQSTYSNLETYEAFFWHNTMIPELMMFGAEYRYFLRGPDGCFPAYDISAVPILRKAQDEHATKIMDGAKSGFFTRAQVKAAFGEPFDPELDNVYLLPFNVQIVPALSATAATDSGGAAAMDEDERAEESAPGKQYKSAYTAEQRAAFYKQFDTTAQAFEDATENAARAALRTDERNIRAILNAAKSTAYTERKNVSWATEWNDTEDYLNGAGKAQWQEKFDPVFTAITEATGERLESTFGISFDVVNVLANEWLQNYKLTFADPIMDTSIEELQFLFEKAMLEGWSIDRMEQNLTALFNRWVEGGLSDEELLREVFAGRRLPPHRARMIARTETIRASNAGSMAVYDEWGVEMTEWLSTPDNRTRDSHKVGSAWGAEPLIAAMGEAFILPTSGAALMFPGDPGAPLDETIQCRCTVLPVFE